MQLINITKGLCFCNVIYSLKINENPGYVEGITDSIILILI